MYLNSSNLIDRIRTDIALFGTVLSLSAVTAYAQTPAPTPRVPETQQLEVTGSLLPTPTPQDDTRPKLNHIMKEVSGTEITVTKKATVIKLDQQPTVINNNQQELFSKAPGFLITQQQTPGQFNFSYRGLGNPQESEFILSLQDRVPMMTDWIGFPTLYYTPLPQSISEIQFIRGGSSLLYGPEPAPAINWVTKHPLPGSPISGYTEQSAAAMERIRPLMCSRERRERWSSAPTLVMSIPPASAITVSPTCIRAIFMSVIVPMLHSSFPSIFTPIMSPSAIPDE
jgi:outer membrane receptor protein involved in Fe transport